MKYGKTLEQLAAEVVRQRESRRDFVADTRHVRLGTDGTAVDLQLDGDDPVAFGINPIAHGQLAEHLKIPKAYYDRMLATAPELLIDNANHWLRANPERRMVRTLDGNARAFLSNAYRPLDNAELMEAVLPPLLSRNLDVMSAEITERRLYLKVVDRSIRKDIPTGREMGDGTHTIFDTHSPGMVISNSEVGFGALAVQTSIFTHACTNLAVFAERSTRRYHVGARAELGDEAYALLSDDTRRLTDRAFWAQIGDVVSAAFDRARFDEIADRLAHAAGDRIETDPAKVVELTAKKFDLTDGERGSILTHLARGGDLSRYGLHAAVTRASADLDDYDRASDLERLGGKIIELGRAEWRELVAA